MDRECNICKQVLPITSFYKGRGNKDGYRPSCKSCHKSKYPSTTPARQLERVYATRLRNRQFLAEYLRDHECVDCGEDDIVVLDFDHVRGKKVSNVSKMVHNTMSLKKIQEEIDKCDVVCANCHRRRTAATQQWDKYLSQGAH